MDDKPQGFTPSVIPQEMFTPWLRMHKDSFCKTTSCVVEQCNDSVGFQEGLLFSHCSKLPSMIDSGECDIEMVPDGTKYRNMRSRVGGNPELASKLTPNLIKQLGRKDRAMRCVLDTHIVVDWFSGEDGSCYNLGFLYLEATRLVTVVTVETTVEKTEYFFGGDTKIMFSDAVTAGAEQRLDAVFIPNCPGSSLIRDFDFEMNNGSTIQSTGYYNQ